MDLRLAIKIFLIIIAVFFPIFWYFCYLWTERKELSFRNLLGAFSIALLVVFKMTLLGAFLIFIAYLAITLI